MLNFKLINFRAMRNFSPFLPTIPFGNQKMKIMETKSQEVDMDIHISKLLKFVWETIFSNFCNCFFVSCQCLFLVCGRSFFQQLAI